MRGSPVDRREAPVTRRRAAAEPERREQHHALTSTICFNGESACGLLAPGPALAQGQKRHSDGDVHLYFTPCDSPHDPFLFFMNVLDDMTARIERDLARTRQEPRS